MRNKTRPSQKPLNTRFSIDLLSKNRNALILFLFSVIIYSNTLFHDFTLDDKGTILNNRFFIEDTNLVEVFTTNYRFGANTPNDGLYRPFAMTTYLVNHHFSGFDPFSYHLTNVIINAFTIVLLYHLLLRLGISSITSFTISILFSAHPVHTESVANIAGRPEILYTLFLICTWLLIQKGPTTWPRMAAAAILYACALLSKETAIMFLPIYAVSIILQNKRRSLSTYLPAIIALSIVIVLYLGIRFYVLGDTTTGNIPRYYNNPLFYMDSISRIQNAVIILGRYILLLLFPLYLRSDYSYKTFSLFNGTISISAILILSVIILLSALIYRYRKTYPESLLGLAIFLFPMSLVANILLPIGTIMGERFLYFPSLGLILICVTYGSVLLKSHRNTLRIITTVILVLFTIRTIDRNNAWKNDQRLTRTDLLHAPDNIKLLANMALYEKENGNITTAKQLYRQSLTIYADFTEAVSGLARIAYDQGNLNEALELYQEAVTMDPEDPETHFSYISLLIQRKELTKAEQSLERATISLPDSYLLQRCLGNLRLEQHRYHEAIQAYEQARAFGDNKQITYTNQVVAAYAAGDLEQAWQFVEEAQQADIQLNPNLIQSIRNELINR